jgi:drug/metabolite transporter (DMT)-like permease
VTFLIPAFGVLWGGLFLGESFTAAMGWGCAAILIGTGLTNSASAERSVLAPAQART